MPFSHKHKNLLKLPSWIGSRSPESVHLFQQGLRLMCLDISQAREKVIHSPVGCSQHQTHKRILLRNMEFPFSYHVLQPLLYLSSMALFNPLMASRDGRRKRQHPSCHFCDVPYLESQLPNAKHAYLEVGFY